MLDTLNPKHEAVLLLATKAHNQRHVYRFHFGSYYHIHFTAFIYINSYGLMVLLLVLRRFALNGITSFNIHLFDDDTPTYYKPKTGIIIFIIWS